MSRVLRDRGNDKQLVDLAAYSHESGPIYVQTKREANVIPYKHSTI